MRSRYGVPFVLAAVKVTVTVAVSMACAGCGLFSSSRGSGEIPGRVGQPTGVQKFDFEKAPLGAMPPGFSAALTGDGPPPRWQVLEADQPGGGRRVLAQTSAEPNSYRYPVCVSDSPWMTHVSATVRFRCISGQVDQAAGVVVRYRDKNNYYVARANALEDNVRFYRVKDGKRSQIADLKAQVTPLAWHTLSLRAHGNHFTITFDDKSFEADDATFPGPGLVGVWTKADSVTWFDGLTVESYEGK
jgi:hypothetical protein